MFKRLAKLLRQIPFLFRRCACGKYHPFWVRMCFGRVGQHSENWHGGILDLRTGREWTPAAEMLHTRTVNNLGGDYGAAMEVVAMERRKLMQAITFFFSLRDSRADLFKISDAVAEMHCAIDRLAKAEETLHQAWIAVLRYDRFSEGIGRIGCHNDCAYKTEPQE